MSLGRSWHRIFSAALLLLALLAATGAARAQVVINEVDYDQPGTDTSEWIELKNIGTSSVNLSAYALVFLNGATSPPSPYNNSPVALPNVMLAAGDYFVVCANAATTPSCDFDAPGVSTDWIQNGYPPSGSGAPDAIKLTLNGIDHDVLSYEGDVPGAVEGSGVPRAGGDDGVGATGLSRCPDGSDTNNNSVDFILRPTTPGAPNNCAGGGGGALGSCGDAATLISAIQGPGTVSPLVGMTVNVEAVMVGDFQDAAMNGFYLQEEDAQHDADPSTSEGIFVDEGSLNVPASTGNLVRVRGTVSENQFVTQLALSEMVVCPGTPIASTQTFSLPVPSLGFAERYEGMRVSIAQLLTVTGNFELGRFGSVDLSVGGRLFEPTHLVEPGQPAIDQQDLNQRSRIILDDLSNGQNPNPIPYKDASNTRRLGDTLPSLEGILEDRFGALRIRPTGAIAFTSGNPRPAAPPAVGGRLKVASLNVLNYFTTLDSGVPVCGPSANLDCRGADNASELTRQRTKILNALESMHADAVGLIELENNASTSIQDLVNGLNARPGVGPYSFIDTGTIGTDAIKVALIYKPAKVTPVGGYALLTSAVDPLFIDSKNRPSLAQTFQEVGSSARVTLVVNHFKSKGSACDDVGDPDLGDGQGNCNQTRTDAAIALADWIAGNPTGSGDGRVLLMGDFNAYAKEDPIQQLKTDGLIELVATWLGPSAYSYQFQGESGYLDSAFATSALTPQITGVAAWHSNADEPVVLDYNTEFKTDDPYNASDPFRASDHDAILIGLALTSSAAVPAGSASMNGTLAALLLAIAAGVLWHRRALA
jgi:hypothetical protein